MDSEVDLYWCKQQIIMTDDTQLFQTRARETEERRCDNSTTSSATPGAPLGNEGREALSQEQREWIAEAENLEIVEGKPPPTGQYINFGKTAQGVEVKVSYIPEGKRGSYLRASRIVDRAEAKLGKARTFLSATDDNRVSKYTTVHGIRTHPHPFRVSSDNRKRLQYLPKNVWYRTKEADKLVDELWKTLDQTTNIGLLFVGDSTIKLLRPYIEEWFRANSLTAGIPKFQPNRAMEVAWGGATFGELTNIKFPRETGLMAAAIIKLNNPCANLWGHNPYVSETIQHEVITSMMIDCWIPQIDDPRTTRFFVDFLFC